jgi:TRAP-type transport system periplasmic protein
MKTNKFVRVLVGSVLVSLLVLSLIPGVSVAADAGKTFKWKCLAMINLKVYYYGPALYAMFDEIKEKTGGRLQVDVFLPGETPIAPKDFLRAIKEGATEIAEVYPGYFGATEPVLNVTNLPMLMPSKYELVESIYDEIKGQVFKPIFAKWGGVSLAEYWFPFHAIGAPVAINSWDSLKGLKVRVTGVEAADFIKMMGGVPVTVAWAEVPSALMTGVIDGVQTSGDGFWSAKLWEYPKIKYINLLEIAAMPCSLVVSEKALAELPEDIRKIVVDTMKKYQPTLREKQWLFDSHCYRIGIVDFNATVVAPPKKFRAEVVEKAKTAIWQPWVERAGAPGKAALETVQQKIAAKSK